MPLLGCIILLAVGCKTEEEKIFDSIFDIQERALTILKEVPDDGQEAVKQINALEEETREIRAALRKRWKALGADSKDKPNKAVEKRFQEYREKFDARLKRYSKEHQQLLRFGIGALVR